jgi:hypothetical protein
VIRARRFERAKDGQLVVRLHPEEVALLHRLADELQELFDKHDAVGESDSSDSSGASGPSGPGDDNEGDRAVLSRLFPRAYLDPTEEEAEQEWQRFSNPDLVVARVAAVRDLVDSLPANERRDGRVEGKLDEEHQAAWLGVLNDARLAIGTRLGVTEDDDYTARAPDDPSYLAWQVYAWLTDLQADLIDVLLGGLPRGGTD